MRKEPNSNRLADYPHVDLLYPSKYLKGEDLDGEEVVTIAAIEPRHELARTDNSKEHKPVVLFRETQKAFVMNKTNARLIASVHGNELSGWVGKQIVLTTAKVSAFGKVHNAIRVKPVRAVQRGGKSGSASRDEAEAEAAGLTIVAEAQTVADLDATKPRLEALGLTGAARARVRAALDKRRAELEGAAAADGKPQWDSGEA